MLIDTELKCWLLEINYNPSLNIYFDTSNPNDEVEMTDADICPVDLYVKSKVAVDAMRLVCTHGLQDINQLDSM